jgi:hypothetical protein
VVFYVFGLKVNWDRVWYRLGTVRRRSGSQGQAESAVQLAVQIWRSNGATVFPNSKNYNTIFLFAGKEKLSRDTQIIKLKNIFGVVRFI